MIELLLFGSMSIIFGLSIFYLKRNTFSSVYSYSYIVIGFTSVVCALGILTEKVKEAMFLSVIFLILQIFIYIYYVFNMDRRD